jgi:4-hydroxybenzoate polyprenyltransferase
MNFLRLIRFPNLIIVALTQYLLQYLILKPALSKIGIQPYLPNFPFFLLVLSTVFIAAGGYIVNDIVDLDIDKLNKPLKKQIVGRVYPLSMSWVFYGFFSILGFIISVYLAFYIHDFLQLMIYPLAVGLLWAYSKWLKQLPLMGNLVVSIFCAFVAFVVFYAQSLYMPTAVQWKTGYLKYQLETVEIFIIYAILAFISTLFREIIKDIEDAEGDKAGNCRTLPIVLGIEKSKWVAGVVGLMFLFLVIYGSIILRGGMVQKILLNATISLPIIYALFLLYKAASKADFSFLSKLAKLIMLSGLIFILILKLTV